MTTTTTQTVTVTGMTCDHCVRAVTEEVSSIPGVQQVDVDLGSGAVTVTSAAPVERDVLAAAVDEAGYALAES